MNPLIAISVLLIPASVLVWAMGRLLQQRQPVEVTAMATSEQRAQMLHTMHPDIIPAVPLGVSALDFRGWFNEANRRIETWAVAHRSAADMALRIQLQRQINELEEEHLRYGRTRSEQELLQRRHELEVKKLELQLVEAEDQIEQIKDRAGQRKKNAAPPKTDGGNLFDKIAQTFKDQERERKKYAGNPEMLETIDAYYDELRAQIRDGRR
jgi:hypothetical protein